MKQRYSIFSLVRNALNYHADWQEAWRSPDPKPAYDVIIIGGGGHGLATAYYLAKEHGITNVAVLEKGWLGGGNTGRNTTIVRSNYLWDESAHLYEHALKLWEGLSQDLNYNVMFSQRGIMNLAHTVHDMQALRRRVYAIQLNGIDSEILTPAQIKELVPMLDCSPNARYPIMGASFQRRGGTARHDAVAWGYARGADERGVDIIQNCEVTGFKIVNGTVQGVETTRGFIGAKKVGVVVAGHSGVLAGMAGFRLPLESHPLQALVSEPIKPILDTVVMSPQVHVYVSQSDKGELVLGAGIDAFNSYAQAGSPPIVENQLNALCDLFPAFSRLRMMRQWGGIVDTCPDASPIIGKTPVQNLFINCGWGTGGFKATPGSGNVFAHTLARGEPHPLAVPFALERFTTGYLIDEHGAAGVAH
ncbi:sarcosine oxidase subunit beta family protein [Dongia soli]|uniref:Sarcosine oxidase subunit beta n=1 Tax=Dongia soli TaxID=600628 RepID=A0ABU5EBH4_9PROT|nr:sarcosine oxidase subunit beta family protein [Dongia soli]MDY0882920.1 sarcosine oxidase subunit beta family protein [Dongia soli]